MTTSNLGWFRRHLTVRLRLMALLVLAGVLLGGLGHRLLGGVDRLGGVVDELAKREMPSLESIGQVRAAFLRAYLSERSLLFQSMASDSAKATVADHTAAIEAAGAAWRRFAATSPEHAAAIDFQGPWAEWCKVTREVLGVLAEDTPAGRRDAIDLSMGLSKETAQAVDLALDAAARACSEEARRKSLAASTEASHQKDSFYQALGIGLGVLVALGLLIVHSVVGPLRRTVKALRDCAEGAGDLSQRLPAASGEIGELATSFNRFVEGLGAMVAAMRHTATDVQGAARQVATVGDSMAGNSQSVAQRLDTAGQAAHQVQEVTNTAASSTRELSASIQEIANNAQRLTMTAQEVGQSAATTFANVEAMGRDSVHIQRIVGVIDGIARQTNLLALNASVEAARAGEYGAGFSVVAERVKSLSIDSAKATAEIGQRIGAFIASVQRTITEIGSIKEATIQLGNSTSGIASSVEEQSAVTQEFADSFATIKDASDRIAKELAGIQSSATAASEGATSARSASTSLVQASTRLSDLVGNFTT